MCNQKPAANESRKRDERKQSVCRIMQSLTLAVVFLFLLCKTYVLRDRFPIYCFWISAFEIAHPFSFPSRCSPGSVTKWIFACCQNPVCSLPTRMRFSCWTNLLSFGLTFQKTLLLHILADSDSYSGKANDAFDVSFIVQTDFHIFLDNRTLDFHRFKPLTILLTILVNMDFGE